MGAAPQGAQPASFGIGVSTSHRQSARPCRRVPVRRVKHSPRVHLASRRAATLRRSEQEATMPTKPGKGRGRAKRAIELHAHGGYERLLRAAQALDAIRVAVAHPCSPEALQAAIDARDEDLIVPVLVGPKARIAAIAKKCGIALDGVELVDTEHSHAAAMAAVRLAREGKVAAVMKGSLHTDELLHAVLDRDCGLRTERRVSHAFLMDVPKYPRPLLITDAAVNIAPTLSDKADILQNALDLMHRLGYEAPRVAILSAVETVNPAIVSTIEAAALCKMVDRGQVTGGIVDGPLAFDNAVSAEAARIKGIASPVAGRADVLLVPDLESGNMLYKQLVYLAGADAAGVVLGARVPIILTSRADNLRIRLASCALAVVLASSPRKRVD
jgi:phosphotransacetylase